jgi:4-hydroxy-tetrahydrodipicolinate synthase
LLEHFKAAADSVEIPTILYNVPSRTVTSLEVETIKKLSEHPRIIGIKEASGNIEFAKKIANACGKEFTLLSGDDGTYEHFVAAGGTGVISVASHIIPKAMIDVEISPNKELIDLLFVEANPIPVKMALHLMGIIQTPDVRLPLVKMSEGNAAKLKQELKRKKLI